MLNIKPNDLVLEIGGGNRPFDRSNILCDKFIDNNYQRADEKNIVIDDRPFVVADGLALPFKNKSFDYVIASHVLEHVDDPDLFVKELMRVSKAGYIETPSELGEKIFGWPYHKWLVRIEDDTLVIRPKTNENPFNNYFHNIFKADPFFAEFIDSHRKDFYVQYEWKDVIKLKIEKNLSPVVKLNVSSFNVEINSKYKIIKILIVRKIILLFLKLLRHFRKF